MKHSVKDKSGQIREIETPFFLKVQSEHNTVHARVYGEETPQMDTITKYPNGGWLTSFDIPPLKRIMENGVLIEEKEFYETLSTYVAYVQTIKNKKENGYFDKK